MTIDHLPPRVAGVGDAEAIADLLDRFNTEFEVSSPGPAVLAGRLRTLLGGRQTLAVVAGEPPVAVALLTLRPNVWNDGPVALLDELYVLPDRRGGGLGSAVLAEVFEQLERRGVELLEVNVDEGDVDAQRFYARHGVTMVDPDTDERAFYMYRELDTSERATATDDTQR